MNVSRQAEQCAALVQSTSGHSGPQVMALRGRFPRGWRGLRAFGDARDVARSQKRERASHGGPPTIAPSRPSTSLARCETVFPERTGVVYGEERRSWGAFASRCRRLLASALAGLGVGHGDTVAIMCPNTPAMLEAHFGVPMIGAVLNAINIRLDAPRSPSSSSTARPRCCWPTREFTPPIAPALALLGRSGSIVIDIVDPAAPGAADSARSSTRAARRGRSRVRLAGARRTSGTRSASATPRARPATRRASVYNHRGAYLDALGNALTFRLDHESRYLWTLPMFHCSGWTFTWAVAAAGGTHVCLRKVDPAHLRAIGEHRVTHMCGAPIVLNMLVHAPGRGEAPAAAAHRGRDRRSGAARHRHRSAWRRWASRCCTSTAPPRATVPPPSARRCPSGRRCPRASAPR